MRRIVGEFKKLALRPGRITVRRVLIDEGVLPDRNRHAPKEPVGTVHQNSFAPSVFEFPACVIPVGAMICFGRSNLNRRLRASIT